MVVGIAQSEVKANTHEYSLTEDTDTLGADILDFLLPHLAALKYQDGIPMTAQLIVGAATGFTYERRVQIYDLLRKHPKQSMASIASSLQIPWQAAQRHLAKLAKRGYIRGTQEGATRLFTTVTPALPINRDYAKVIQIHL